MAHEPKPGSWCSSQVEQPVTRRRLHLASLGRFLYPLCTIYFPLGSLSAPLHAALACSTAGDRTEVSYKRNLLVLSKNFEAQPPFQSHPEAANGRGEATGEVAPFRVGTYAVGEAMIAHGRSNMNERVSGSFFECPLRSLAFGRDKSEPGSVNLRD